MRHENNIEIISLLALLINNKAEVTSVLTDTTAPLVEKFEELSEHAINKIYTRVVPSLLYGIGVAFPINDFVRELVNMLYFDVYLTKNFDQRQILQLADNAIIIAPGKIITAFILEDNKIIQKVDLTHLQLELNLSIDPDESITHHTLEEQEFLPLGVYNTLKQTALHKRFQDAFQNLQFGVYFGVRIHHDNLANFQTQEKYNIIIIQEDFNQKNKDIAFFYKDHKILPYTVTLENLCGLTYPDSANTLVKQNFNSTLNKLIQTLCAQETRTIFSRKTLSPLKRFDVKAMLNTFLEQINFSINAQDLIETKEILAALYGQDVPMLQASPHKVLSLYNETRVVSFNATITQIANEQVAITSIEYSEFMHFLLFDFSLAMKTEICNINHLELCAKQISEDELFSKINDAIKNSFIKLKHASQITKVFDFYFNLATLASRCNNHAVSWLITNQLKKVIEKLKFSNNNESQHIDIITLQDMTSRLDDYTEDTFLAEWDTIIKFQRDNSGAIMMLDAYIAELANCLKNLQALEFVDTTPEIRLQSLRALYLLGEKIQFLHHKQCTYMEQIDNEQLKFSTDFYGNNINHALIPIKTHKPHSISPLIGFLSHHRDKEHKLSPRSKLSPRDSKSPPIGNTSVMLPSLSRDSSPLLSERKLSPREKPSAITYYYNVIRSSLSSTPFLLTPPESPRNKSPRSTLKPG